MIELQRTGFFREMPHGEPTDPSLAEARNPSPVPHEDRIAAYLDAGHIHTAATAPTRDVFDASKSIGPPHYLTDGRFVWPGDLAHYVRTYHVRLPGAFIEHMLSHGWTVPAEIDLTALVLPPRTATIRPELGGAFDRFVTAAREALNGPDGEKLRTQLSEMGNAVSRFFEKLATSASEAGARSAAETEQRKTDERSEQAGSGSPEGSVRGAGNGETDNAGAGATHGIHEPSEQAGGGDTDGSTGGAGSTASGGISERSEQAPGANAEGSARAGSGASRVTRAIDQAGDEAARAAGAVADDLRKTFEEAGARLRSRLSSSLRALSDWLDKPEEERSAQVHSAMSSLQSRLDALRQRDTAEGPDKPAGAESKTGEPGKRDDGDHN